MNKNKADKDNQGKNNKSNNKMVNKMELSKSKEILIQMEVQIEI